MNQRDREMMEQIFGDSEVQDHSEEGPQELSEIEQRQMNVCVMMITSFAEDINQRAMNEQPFFIAPPNNFSYSVN